MKHTHCRWVAGQQGELKPLGRHIAALPCAPRLAKLLAQRPGVTRQKKHTQSVLGNYHAKKILLESIYIYLSESSSSGKT